MALIKSIPTPFGPDAAYWHILAFEANRPQGAARTVLAGYVDAATRAAGCRPLATITLDLAGPLFPGTEEGIRYTDLYAAIKVAANDPNSPAAVLTGAMDG
ncbi:hypothetical protein D3869_32420 (plasmid) [Azospirillum brasilense]|uniref:Uncharacterized protein n=1 Tax=Azospirillum brasilense TaxID=192 RepID=A0A4D8RKU9_AZOBR|nr:hypothetical protein [Azospirillum brasilense]QCO19949.1 hypothetical protein D3869_32420 [Azospirillum brasilense]